jgi:hypothetical protein
MHAHAGRRVRVGVYGSAGGGWSGRAALERRECTLFIEREAQRLLGGLKTQIGLRARFASVASSATAKHDRPMAVPLALSAAAQVCSDFRGTVLSCVELEQARKFNRDIPSLAMLKSSHRSIRREMNKAGLLHALPARWEVGHACPNEPGSARDRGIEDRGQNLLLRRTTTTIPPEVSVVARCRARKPRSITLTTSHATTLVRAARTAALDSQRVRGN